LPMSIHANHKDPHHDSQVRSDPGTSQPQAWCATITPTCLIIQKLHPLIHHVQNSVLYNKTHTNIPAESMCIILVFYILSKTITRNLQFIWNQ